MADQEKSLFEKAKTSLSRIQQFDARELPQVDRLGTDMNFSDAIKPAEKLVGLYTKITLTALEDYPDEILQTILQLADSDYNLLKKILDFDSKTQNKEQRDSLVNSIASRYSPVFNALHPLISYSMHRATDFEALDAQARAKLQEISDRGNEIESELAKTKDEAEKVLNQVRDVAAEQGVSQQAVYFKDEADKYESDANKWLNLSIAAAIMLAIYAVLSFNFTQWFLPEKYETYEMVQFAVSKILLFGVFLYALYFCAKNYFSARHNSVINRHRQNALLTYRSIADAAGNSSNTDIILNHAAMCIYAPQTTGYSSGKSSGIPSSGSPLSFLLKHASGEKGE